MFVDLPKKLQKEIEILLRQDDFPAAKDLYNRYHQARLLKIKRNQKRSNA